MALTLITALVVLAQVQHIKHDILTVLGVLSLGVQICEGRALGCAALEGYGNIFRKRDCTPG